MKNQIFYNPSLKQLKEKYDTEYVERFRRVIKDWNQLIRQFMIKSMGVGLTDNDSSKFSINISIKPAYNNSLFDLIDKQYPTLNFEEFHRLNMYIQEGEACLKYFPSNEAKSLEISLQYARRRLEEFDIDEITKTLFRFLEPPITDVFGCYFIERFDIELYVAPIVLFSQLHGLDLDTMITIVLIHELAHGYNHIGRDKDGYYWENFSETDNFLAEGLAQYYTQEFINKYLYRNNNLKVTFEHLLKHQPDQYNIHTTWKASLEQVYRGFIEARRNKVSRYEDFKDMLDQSKVKIRSSGRNYFSDY